MSEPISIIYLLSEFTAVDLTSSAPFLVLIECLFSRGEMCASVRLSNACTCMCMCDEYPPLVAL